MLSILLVDTVGGELHQLLFASFADESTPAPKNYNNNQWKQNLLAMSRFEAYMYKRFWPRSITNVTVHGKTYLNAYPLDKQKR